MSTKIADHPTTIRIGGSTATIGDVNTVITSAATHEAMPTSLAVYNLVNEAGSSGFTNPIQISQRKSFDIFAVNLSGSESFGVGVGPTAASMFCTGANDLVWAPLINGQLWRLDSLSGGGGATFFTIHTDDLSTVVSGCYDGRRLYTTGSSSGILYQILPTTGTVTGTVGMGHTPLGQMVVTPQYVWVANGGTLSSTISRYDPFAEVAATFPCPPAFPLGQLAFDGSRLWVPGRTGVATLVNLDGSTTGASVIVPAGTAYSICFDGQFMWIANSVNAIYKVNVQTLQVVEGITGLSGPTHLVFDGNYIWFIDGGTGLKSIRVSNSALTDIGLQGGWTNIVSLAFDAVYIWLSGITDGSTIVLKL